MHAVVIFLEDTFAVAKLLLTQFKEQWVA